MLQIILVLIALLLYPATAAKADAGYCEHPVPACQRAASLAGDASNFD
jgi:hypothetical protein